MGSPSTEVRTDPTATERQAGKGIFGSLRTTTSMVATLPGGLASNKTIHQEGDRSWASSGSMG